MVFRLASFLLFSMLIQGNALPAFPGAEGYGSDTPGGRGGRVLFVTNLNPSGPGSWKAALLTTGPRIVVFRVSGVVQGQGEILLEKESLSHLTVAGQTSPGGITITSSSGTPIWQYSNSKFHDAIWRFVRFRAGSANDHSFAQYLSYNFIIDHCDFSGGTDECFDMANVYNFTVGWSTIANSGPTGQVYGALFSGKPVHFISIHHNLFAHHRQRMPLIHTYRQPPVNGGMLDYRNNVCYNSGTGWCLEISDVGPTFRVNVVGNYFKAGPTTLGNKYVAQIEPLHFSDSNVVFYEHDDIYDIPGKDTLTGDLADRRYNRSPVLVQQPFDTPPVTTYPLLESYEKVLNEAGAWPRDPMNIRTVKEVRTGTGQMKKVDDPLIQNGPAPPEDTDWDGMPDCWEKSMGFDANNAADNNGDHDGDGYTNIEEYINDMALSQMGKLPHNGILSGGCPTGIEVTRTGSPVSASISVFPNPFKTLTQFRFPAPIDGKLRIFDIGGKQIRAFSIAKGQVISVWDGKDGQGKILPGGLYVGKLEVGSASSTFRIYLTK